MLNTEIWWQKVVLIVLGAALLAGGVAGISAGEPTILVRIVSGVAIFLGVVILFRWVRGKSKSKI